MTSSNLPHLHEADTQQNKTYNITQSIITLIKNVIIMRGKKATTPSSAKNEVHAIEICKPT